MLHMQWKDLIGKQSKRQMPFPQSEKYSEEDFCFRFVKSVLSWQWLSLIWGLKEIKSAVLVPWNKKEPWGQVSEQLRLSYRFYRRSEKSKQGELELSEFDLNKSIRSGGQCSPPRRGWGWPGRSPPGPAVTCELFSVHPLSSTPNKLWEMKPQAHAASLAVPGEWQCIQCAGTWGVQDRQTHTPPLSVISRQIWVGEETAAPSS